MSLNCLDFAITVGTAIVNLISFVIITIINSSSGHKDFRVQRRPKLNRRRSTLKSRPLKSKPELRNSNRNTDCYYSSAKIFESVASHTVFVYDNPAISINDNQ